MDKRINFRKYAIFGASLFLFAFAIPGNSLSPVQGHDLESLGVISPEASLSTLPAEVINRVTAEKAFEEYLDDTFDEMDLRGTGMKKDVFLEAVTGFLNLKQRNIASSNKSIITVVDLSKASRYKRMWVIDLAKKKLLFHTYAAHGQGSGADVAYAFSDTPDSHQSSVGFYVTSNTYFGKHGLSLKLNGMDTGFNANALERAIVVHGADYVSKDFIKQHGRLGRSHGCPAVPEELNEPIINTIKNKTVLYIHGGVDKYSSAYLNKSVAAAHFVRNNNSLSASL